MKKKKKNKDKEKAKKAFKDYVGYIIKKKWDQFKNMTEIDEIYKKNN